MKRLMLVLLVLVFGGCEESEDIDYLELCKRTEDYCVNKYIEDTDMWIRMDEIVKCDDDPCRYIIDAAHKLSNLDTDDMRYDSDTYHALYFCRVNTMYAVLGDDISDFHGCNPAYYP